MPNRFVGGLSGLHTYFTSNNTTTYEHFRTRYSSHSNPYDLGILRNWRSVRSPARFRVLPLVAMRVCAFGHSVCSRGAVGFISALESVLKHHTS